MESVLFVKIQAPASWVLFMISQEEENTAISFCSSVSPFLLPSSMQPISLDFPYPQKFTTPRRNLKSRRLPLLLLQRARKRSFLFCPSLSLPFPYTEEKPQIRFMAALPFSHPGSSLMSQLSTLPEHSSAEIYSCSMPTDSAALPWQPIKILLCVWRYHP